MKTPDKPDASAAGGGDEPVLRPHVYDGIQEYDQKLPNWWLFTFYITIVFFVGYWFAYYQAGLFATDHERVTSQITRIQEAKAKELEKMLAKLDDDVLWEWSRNSVITAEGRLIYQRVCVACHAEDLSATVAGTKLPGLPLNDNEWKYGGNPMDVFRIVSKGSPDKNAPVQMPAWEAALSPSDIAKVSAFVMSHHEKPAAPPSPER